MARRLLLGGMPRKVLLDSRVLPYHINAKANRREPFPGDFEFVWKTLTDELYLQTVLRGIRVHAFVLMPNHFHLLVTTPQAPIHEAMKEFLGSSTRILNTRNRAWGRVFGGRYHWSLVDRPLYYAHALKYVYRNPVKAGLCGEVADYAFGTFGGLVGARSLPLAVHPPYRKLDRLLPPATESYGDLEKWLNQAHRKEEDEAIRRGLKKMSFEPATNRQNRKRVVLPEPA